MRAMAFLLAAFLASCGGEDAPGPDGGGDPCDADGDGHESEECGGDDCCDVDPMAFHGQELWSDEPTACGDYDWNCDGAEELRDPRAETCNEVHYDDLDMCGGSESPIGWVDVPACGETGEYATGCGRDPDLMACVPAAVEPRLQLCR